MVNSSELRIGNWAVNYGNYVCIEADDIVDCHHQPESYDPIPLTPEILEKGGFYHHHDTPHPNRVFRKNFTEGYFELEEIISFFYGGTFCCVQVDYLHQLQNLYFALTGEELQIEL